MLKAFLQVCFLLSTIKELNGENKSQAAVENNGFEGKAVNTPTTTPESSSKFLGHLLVIPMDGSHWMDIKAISQEMGRRGHRVTVVIPEVSLRLGPGKHYTTLTYPVPYGKAEVDALLGEIVETMRKPFMEKISHFRHVLSFMYSNGESLLLNTSLMSHLSQQDFDAVLTSPMVPTGPLIARKLGLPSINVARGVPCMLDLKATACPAPPSYVPRFFSKSTDKMNFKERVINTLDCGVDWCNATDYFAVCSAVFPKNAPVCKDLIRKMEQCAVQALVKKIALMEPLMCRIMHWQFDHLAVEFLGEDISSVEVMKDAAIWLMRTDFTLDHPRPLMPNVVLVGGMNCDLRNPLPEELQPWVSGDDGFVVFTLGSMMSSLPEEIAAVFLEAFRQIPQKVIWRYTGPLPDDVPENVKVMKWVPQNDLLAHPGVRAFITHAGSHGLYEGVCHAVPMVMLPVAGEQPDNAARLASRGVGVVLDLMTVSVETLLQGLSDVINSTRYKENIMKLSALHKDRPINPSELSVYWTEYVMRHKGADHLRPAAHDLNWFQYHSLDVITVLSVVVVVVLMVTVSCMRRCLSSRLFRKRKQD